jgi:dienelactone hydrolase
MTLRRIARSSLCLVTASASLHASRPPQADPPEARSETRHVRCLDRTYDYQLFTPDANAALPAILLMHGAGGRSDDVYTPWLPLARREHVVLIAPEIPRELSFESIAPQVSRCVVEDAKQAATLDPRRIYVFGWSMGGYLTFDIAMFASTYFAGAAVYAAAIADDYFYILGHAERKMPIAIYIGDEDPFVPRTRVRQTRDSLVNRGFPVHYVELKDQNHQFAPVADQLSADAWKYLSAFRLPAP